MNILAETRTMLSPLGVPIETGVFKNKASVEYIVLTPLSDTYPLSADNRKKRSGEIAYETYVTRAREIADQVEELEKQQREIRAAEDNRITETKRIKDILEAINEVRSTDEFDGEIFRRLIDNVIIKDKWLTFNFKVGISKSTTI